MNDRPIPHNLEAESAVLGAILLDPGAIEKLVSVIRPRDFFNAANQRIYSALQLMRMDSEPIDLITVTDSLRASGYLDAVGGAGYVSELTSGVPTASNVKHYAQIVAECSRRRELMRDAEWMAEQAADPSTTPDEIAAEVRERLDSTPSTHKNGFILESEYVPRPADWLIKNYVEKNTLSLDFGDPESGKSFIAVDQACCVASGTPWAGMRANQAAVLYIAGEAPQSVLKRIHAWKIYHRIKTAIPLAVYQHAAYIDDPQSAAGLLIECREMAEQIGKPGLIIIDTVARTMIGDENSTKDMSAFVKACDRIRDAFGCHVKLVHHCGHGDKSRARGSIALPGALDTSYSIDKDEEKIIRMIPIKMKDHEKPDRLAFSFRVVELDVTDEDGNPATSCVMVQEEYTERTKKKESGGANQRAFFKALNDLLEYSEGDAVDEEKLKQRAYEFGLGSGTKDPARRFRETRDALLKAGKIKMDCNQVSFV